MFTHKTGIRYKKFVDTSRIQNVMNPESKEETLDPNTLNPKLFVSCRRVIPRIHIAQVLPRSGFTQDEVCTDLAPWQSEVAMTPVNGFGVNS